MYTLLKCSIFTIYASNLLESIKILFKFNNLSTILVIYDLGILVFVLGISTLTSIVLGMSKLLVFFCFLWWGRGGCGWGGGKNQGRK